MIKNVFIYALIFAVTFDLTAQKTAKITLNVDMKNIAIASIEPFSNFPLYQYAEANVTNGNAILNIAIDQPLMANLKIKEANDRPKYSIPLYLEPRKEITINISKNGSNINPTTNYQGDLAAECYFMKKFKSPIFKLHFSNIDGEKLLEDIRAAIMEDHTCSAKFKKMFLETIDFKVQEKNLDTWENIDPKTFQETLKHLFSELKRSNVWQSIPQWPYVLDNIFKHAEKSGIIKNEGFENRLTYIGDEDTRNRYGIYCLKRYINFRSWFENPPTDIIEKMKPLITTEEGKKDFKEIVKKFESIQQEWEHLRTDKVPDFTFEDVNGEMITLSNFRGKFVLLDVWNIYCGPCMNQIPYLKKMEPKLEKMGVVVIGVSCDPQNIKDKWRATVRNKGMSGIQVIMDNGRDSHFMTDYAIIGFPTFCLIGPDGKMINPYIMRPESPDFMEYIQKKIQEYKN